MGMFDWVKFKTRCPECGSEITGFQSKDGECILDCIEFWQVGYFYSSCDQCNTIVRYTLKKDVRDKIISEIEKIRRSLTIDDYDLELSVSSTRVTKTHSKDEKQ